jgi:hypothetical protein
MLWPLDEGAAVPLCVRIMDQGAPYGGSLRLRLCSGLHVCVCVDEPMLVEWAASAVEIQPCAKVTSFAVHHSSSEPRARLPLKEALLLSV